MHKSSPGLTEELRIPFAPFAKNHETVSAAEEFRVHWRAGPKSTSQGEAMARFPPPANLTAGWTRR
jgi:hypothetical protein